MLRITDLRINRQTKLWDMIIPKHANNVVIGDTYTTFIHPTKGHRRVSNKRLGL